MKRWLIFSIFFFMGFLCTLGYAEDLFIREPSSFKGRPQVTTALRENVSDLKKLAEEYLNENDLLTTENQLLRGDVLNLERMIEEEKQNLFLKRRRPLNLEKTVVTQEEEDNAMIAEVERLRKERTYLKKEIAVLKKKISKEKRSLSPLERSADRLKEKHFNLSLDWEKIRSFQQTRQVEIDVEMKKIKDSLSSSSTLQAALDEKEIARIGEGGLSQDIMTTLRKENTSLVSAIKEAERDIKVYAREIEGLKKKQKNTEQNIQQAIVKEKREKDGLAEENNVLQQQIKEAQKRIEEIKAASAPLKEKIDMSGQVGFLEAEKELLNGKISDLNKVIEVLTRETAMIKDLLDLQLQED